MMKCKQVHLIFIILIISLQIEAQDFIYKKNGDNIPLAVLVTSSKSITYHLRNLGSVYTYYIIRDVTGSTLNNNRPKKIFNPNALNKSNQSFACNTRYNHPLMGFDTIDFSIYCDLVFRWEFKHGNALPGYMQIHFTLADRADWTFRIGSNRCIFPRLDLIIGTTLHYMLGEYFMLPEGTPPPINFYDDSLSDKKQLNGLLASVIDLYNITHDMDVNIGVNVPVHLCPESPFNSSLEVFRNF